MQTVWMLFTLDHEVGAEDALYAYSSPEECLAHQGITTTVPPSSLIHALWNDAMDGQSWYYRNTEEYRAVLKDFLLGAFPSSEDSTFPYQRQPRDVVRLYLWNEVERKHDEMVLRPFIIDQFARSAG